ncbi:MAG: hypothetical protein KAJ81_09750 [Candidatus Latescibacteria bacterium]|nr:hypothetical protein [Candidatus Latescibacterota bacterium]
MGEALHTIERVQNYVQQFGEEPFFERTLRKMLDYRAEQYDRELKEIEGDLRRFEQQYDLSTAAFLEEFQAGRMGDDMDFLEWASLHRMKNRIQARKYALEGV